MEKNTKKPTVLFLDDNPDDERAAAMGLADLVNARVIHPDEVVIDDLTESDLIMVDYKLDQWPRRDGLPISLQPQNGIALAAVLREWSQKTSASAAFALHSAHLDDLRGPLVSEVSEHLIASQFNLEWVFAKESRLPQQVASLANAARSLPDHWDTQDENALQESTARLLVIDPSCSWCDLAWKDILACHPPLQDLETRQDGLRLIRWLLHRILPYPCFLTSAPYLAARLRVSCESLQHALQKGLQTLLADYEYKGILSLFNGVRWWRAGLDSFLWKISDGCVSDPAHVRDSLSYLCGEDLHRSDSPQPVVCVDENFRSLMKLSDPSEAVRIQPQSWPSYADQAWTSRESAKESKRLSMMVWEDDRERL